MPLPNPDEFGLLGGCSRQYPTSSSFQVFEMCTQVFAIITLMICILPLVAIACYETEAAKVKLKQPKGCRRLGLKIESNLTSEFSPKFLRGHPASNCVISLWIYPVKSCGGVELKRSAVINTGMEFDRQFTFAQLKTPFQATGETPEKDGVAGTWEFITQRQYPLLSRIMTEMWVPDESVPGYESHAEDVQSGGVVVLSFPYQRPGRRGKLAKWGAALKRMMPAMQFRVPFDPTPTQVKNGGYKYEDIKIWKDKVRALNMELEIPKELRDYLGIRNKLSLFRIDGRALREVYRCAPTKEDLGWQPVIGFQDAYPLHILNLASVRNLELQMQKGPPRLSATRFRANIIVSGPEAYSEESWKRMRIGNYEYDVSCRTARCKLPNIDQDTGSRHPTEPDRALRKFRNIDPGAGDKVGCLGMQVVPILEKGTIQVGDEVTVLMETDAHSYIGQ